MPPKQTQKPRKKRNNWNKRKRQQNGKQKRHKKGNADMSELVSIFNSVKSNKSRNKTKGKSKSDTASKKLVTSKERNLMIIKNSLKQLSNPKDGRITFISRKKQKKMNNGDKSWKQLESLPNNLSIPSCSLCHNKLIIKRGDQCYSGYASVSCDYCGRDDIHGEVWHCNQCEITTSEINGFNLCKTCGYLISHNRQNEIRRVAPPHDDMGLVFNKSIRNRSKTLDGITIYKHDEIQKTLKIGLGGNTKLCPFDCQCCF